MIENDFLVADINGLEAYLMTANNIKKILNERLYSLDRRFSSISGWSDNVQQKTAEVLSGIKQTCSTLFDAIDELNRKFGMYIEDLRAYNDPFNGSISRF